MKIVVSDLDGTLLRSDRSISDRTLDALKKLKACGVDFAIATARPPRQALKLLPPEFDQSYMICYNGAEIYKAGIPVYKKYMDAETVKCITDRLLLHYPGIRISLEIENRLYANFDVSKIPGWSGEYTLTDFHSFSHQAAAKILVELAGILDLNPVKCILPDSCVLLVTDKGSLGQIMHREVSKSNGVKFLASRHSYCLKDVIAFGDDFNDLDIILECGTGVAMGNAEEALKNAADIVAATNDEDGVAAVLEKLFGI